MIDEVFYPHIGGTGMSRLSYHFFKQTKVCGYQSIDFLIPYPMLFALYPMPSAYFSGGSANGFVSGNG